MAALAALFLAPAPSNGFSLEWVAVGDPGNPPHPDSGWGSVSTRYEISTYVVTVAQYAEFLNAVAESDPNNLYPPVDPDHPGHAIERSGSPGSFGYSPIPEHARKPAIVGRIWDAMRLANWLHNGQPTGAQGPETTEDGAYTLTEEGMESRSISRNEGARVFLPNLEEWYKAAYYDPSSGRYYFYPTASDTTPICSVPTGSPNRANCDDVVHDFTEVGAYTGSPSAVGTFDQAGNALEWIDNTRLPDPEDRILYEEGGNGYQIGDGIGTHPSVLGAPWAGLVGSTVTSRLTGVRLARRSDGSPCTVQGTSGSQVVLPGSPDSPACRCVRDAGARELHCAALSHAVFAVWRLRFPIATNAPFKVETFVVSLKRAGRPSRISIEAPPGMSRIGVPRTPSKRDELGSVARTWLIAPSEPGTYSATVSFQIDGHAKKAQEGRPIVSFPIVVREH